MLATKQLHAESSENVLILFTRLNVCCSAIKMHNILIVIEPYLQSVTTVSMEFRMEL